MQLITLLAYIEASPTLRASGDTKAAVFTAQVAAYKHDDPPMVIDATVWGAAADIAAAKIQADSYWILSGRFRIEKGQPLGLQVEKFDAAPIGRHWSAGPAATPRPAISSRAPWLQISPWR